MTFITVVDKKTNSSFRINPVAIVAIKDVPAAEGAKDTEKVSQILLDAGHIVECDTKALDKELATIE